MTNQSNAKKLTITPKGISVFLLIVYIFFSFTSAETLLPPVLHSLSMYAFLGWSLLCYILSKKFTIPGFTVWLLLMLALSFFSWFWAEHQVGSAIYIIFVALVITFFVIQTIDKYEYLETCLIAFVFSADVMGIMLAVTGQITEEERLGENVTGNANSFSALLMIAAVCALWCWFYKSGKVQRIFHFSSAIFLLVLMAFSGGRKTIIGVFVCWIWFLFVKNASKAWGYLKAIFKISLLLFAIYLIMMKIPFMYDLVGFRFEGLFDFLSGGSSTVGSDKLRAKMVEIGLKKWLDSPFIGYGIDTFKYYNRRMTGHFYYAHNNYVELLYDLGIVGFLAYYGYIAYMIKKLIKMKKESDKYRAFGIGIVFLLLFYDLGGISYYATFMLLVLSLAFICYHIDAKNV